MDVRSCQRKARCYLPRNRKSSNMTRRQGVRERKLVGSLPGRYQVAGYAATEHRRTLGRTHVVAMWLIAVVDVATVSL
jgi:hypothetical protein